MSYEFEIITDSCSSIEEAYAEANGVHVLTLSYILDGVEKPGYAKGQPFDAKGFYDALRKKIKASTSQVNFDQAYNMIKPLLEAGKDVLYIGFSSGLSGTYASVASAMEELRGEFPDRKIMHEDTLTASVGFGYYLVEKAVEMRAEGKTIEEAHKFVVDTKMKIDIWATVDDLFHLQRGGRLSAPAAFFGSLLGVKPVITVNDEGKLIPHSKVRGRGKAIDFLADKIKEKADPNEGQVVWIIHGDALEDAKTLEQKIRAKCKVADVRYTNLEPVIGTHTGPGVLAVSFLVKKRG